MLDATEGGVTGSSELPDVDVGDRTLVFCKHAKHSSPLSYLCSPQLVTILMTQFPPLGPFYHSTFLKDKGWTFQEQSRFLFTIPLTSQIPPDADASSSLPVPVQFPLTTHRKMIKGSIKWQMIKTHIKWHRAVFLRTWGWFASSSDPAVISSCRGKRIDNHSGPQVKSQIRGG